MTTNAFYFVFTSTHGDTICRGSKFERIIWVSLLLWLVCFYSPITLHQYPSLFKIDSLLYKINFFFSYSLTTDAHTSLTHWFIFTIRTTLYLYTAKSTQCYVINQHLTWTADSTDSLYLTITCSVSHLFSMVLDTKIMFNSYNRSSTCHLHKHWLKEIATFPWTLQWTEGWKWHLQVTKKQTFPR